MILSEFRSVYHGTLIGNCGYDKASAESAIRDGHADFIAFGRPYISNPDLVERFKLNAEPNPYADMQHWHSPIGAKGYTDYPRLSG